MWGGTHARQFPEPLGRRYLAHLNTPDHVVWPQTFPNLESCSVFAGLEVPFFHFGTALLSATLGRSGLVNLGKSPLVDVLHNATEWTGARGFGSGNGGMYVSVTTFSGKQAVWDMFAVDRGRGLLNCEEAATRSKSSARALKADP